MKLMRRVRRWAGRFGVRHTLAFGLSTAALGSGVATYLALTGAPPFGLHPNTVLTLLNLDLVLLLALGALIAKRLLQVWAERRRGLAGSRLQIRLVVLFSLIAVTPTIIVAVFSYLFFSYGVEILVQRRVHTAITESLAVAEAYLHEHQQAIRADALAMANDLNRDAPELTLDQARLEQVVAAQAALRGLTEAMVFDRSWPCTGAVEPVIHARFRADAGRCDARRRRRRRGDRDQRQRQPGARPGSPRPVWPSLSLCRPFYRAARAQSHGGDPARCRPIREDGRSAIGVSGHLRA